MVLVPSAAIVSTVLISFSTPSTISWEVVVMILRCWVVPSERISRMVSVVVVTPSTVRVAVSLMDFTMLAAAFDTVSEAPERPGPPPVVRVTESVSAFCAALRTFSIRRALASALSAMRSMSSPRDADIPPEEESSIPKNALTPDIAPEIALFRPSRADFSVLMTGITTLCTAVNAALTLFRKLSLVL